MAWLELNALVTPNDAQAMENIFFACHALAVTFEDNADYPLFEVELGTMPLWPSTLLKALFPQQPAAPLIEQISLLWQIDFATMALPEINYRLIEDQDWQQISQANFQPIAVTDQLWIVPSWHQPVDAKAINLRLDPGLAFGTGSHPTTLLCLRWLTQMAQQTLFSKAHVLDFGCGSGILSCAAILLGALQVDGVDIDQQALQASRYNAEQNHIDAKQLSLFFTNQAPLQPYSFIVANILANTLIEYAPWLNARLAVGGQFALSGILPSQLTMVKKTYQQQGLQFIDTVIVDGWVLMSGIKS